MTPSARSLHLAYAVALLALGLAGPARAAFTPCTLAGDTGPAVAAECLALEVPFAPDPAEAGVLTLFVARIASSHPSPAPDPVLIIAGGPGQAASDLFLALQPAFAPILRDRDVILVDQRGTGRSLNRFACAADDPSIEQLTAAAATALAETCVAELPVDPRWFTTSMTVRDLEHVRLALGIERWNLYGVSYGTRVAQHYLRRYPDAVRAVILDGVVPTTAVLGPALGITAAAAFEHLAARCRSERPCVEAFGDPAEKLRALVTALAAAPEPVSLRDPRTGRPRRLALTAANLTSAVRFLSYRTETAALLPLLLDAASRGDFAPLAAQAALVAAELEDGLSFALQAAVICSEDAPAFAQASSPGEDPYGFGLLAPLEALCAAWPRGIVDPDLKSPLLAAHPMLILSGELDPVTPPADAESAIALGLSNVLHVVGPGQGHGLAPLGCVPRLMRAFFTDPAPRALDASCVERLAPAPFFLGYNGPGP